MVVEEDLPLPQPGARPRRYLGAGFANDDEAARGTGMERKGKHLGRIEVYRSAGLCDEQDSICLADALLGPRRERFIGDIDNEASLGLQRVQPPGQFRALERS